MTAPRGQQGAGAARSLALVIPVRNDARGLAALLRQAAEMGCFSQVVIADDASDRRVRRWHVPLSLLGCTTVLRSRVQGGAGQARNRALAAVGCSHLVFFDSDDLFTADLPPLWQELDGEDFDFCLFRHYDSRALAQGRLGQMPVDDLLWRMAGCAAGGLQMVSGLAAARLAETANYPWNKIYRTAFLREHGVRFSELPVHNDIAAHWQSFACAGRILASDRAAAVHAVREGGGRLTNRRSAERLRVFEALAEAAAAVRARHGTASVLMLALLRFACGLIDWVRGQIETGLQAEFDRLAAGFLGRELGRDGLSGWLSREDPVLALRVTLLMAQGTGRGQS
ncbi:glycosyltransferase family A protein [Leisingera sp. JC11]|uniref:glycosyltransferase family 2 protein n=1 Tax=Leisingera sp. JC11 TaxID=3042469 RepID=UPI0034535DC9